MGSLFPLQQIFPTQEWNWGLLYFMQILYQLSYQGSPQWSKAHLFICQIFWVLEMCELWARHIILSKKLTVQFSSVAQSCPTLCDPMDCSVPGFPVHHQLLELTQTHVHWVNYAIQSLHPLSSPSPPTFNHCQHQGLFKWISSSHQVAKILEFQLQHQSFQRMFRTYFL